MSRLIREVRGPVTVTACDSCGRFCSAESGSVLHATDCDGGKRWERFAVEAAANVQPVLAPGTRAAKVGVSVPLNTVGNGDAEDEFHRVHSVNPKDWNRAMNRDD
jgi:hypothetical protein